MLGKPFPQRNSFIWDNWPKVVNPSTPWKREIWDTKWFQRIFAEYFRQKGVKYATKTVIKIFLWPPDPTHSHLGQLSVFGGMLPLEFLSACCPSLGVYINTKTWVFHKGHKMAYMRLYMYIVYVVFHKIWQFLKVKNSPGSTSKYQFCTTIWNCLDCGI